MRLTIHTDGGSRGNPGPSAYAAIVKVFEGETLITDYEVGGYIASATNNVVEYTALYEALNSVLARYPEPVKQIEIFSDSRLVVEQINGAWQSHNRTLATLKVRCWAVMDVLRENGSTITVTWVRREQNKEADAYANRILDENQ
jgi:ribonuclease HI